jgi:hypothetical protein
MSMKGKLNGLSTESGVALVVSLIVMLIVILLGAGVAISARGARSVGVSLKNQESAFEVAVAGLERAREVARRTAFQNNEATFSNRLLAAANSVANGLVSSTKASFGSSSGTVNGTDDLPIVTTQNLDGSSYQVFLNNDDAEGASTTTDNNLRIKLTSFATGPNGVGTSVVQAEYGSDFTATIPSLPGGMLMPGPTAVYNPPNSNSFDMSGDAGAPNNCYPAIGVTTDAAATVIRNAIAAVNRESRYQTCNPSGGAALISPTSIENFINSTTTPNPYNTSCVTDGHDPVLAEGGAELTSVDYVNNLVAQITAAADYVGANDQGPGFDLGSPLRPKIVVINGDLTVGPGDFGGILVVTGNLYTNGNTSYTGVILAAGRGYLERSGNGNGSLCGGVIVATTLGGTMTDPDGGSRNGAQMICGVNRVGVPRANFNGGGNGIQAPAGVNCDRARDTTQARMGRSLDRFSFQILR